LINFFKNLFKKNPKICLKNLSKICKKIQLKNSPGQAKKHFFQFKLKISYFQSKFKKKIFFGTYNIIQPVMFDGNHPIHGYGDFHQKLTVYALFLSSLFIFEIVKNKKMTKKSFRRLVVKSKKII
jgi:hypothetical protein